LTVVKVLWSLWTQLRKMRRIVLRRASWLVWKLHYRRSLARNRCSAVLHEDVLTCSLLILLHVIVHLLKGSGSLLVRLRVWVPTAGLGLKYGSAVLFRHLLVKGIKSLIISTWSGNRERTRTLDAAEWWVLIESILSVATWSWSTTKHHSVTVELLLFSHLLLHELLIW